MIDPTDEVPSELSRDLLPSDIYSEPKSGKNSKQSNKSRSLSLRNMFKSKKSR